MSVLTRASFEQTLPVLINASARSGNKADDMSAAKRSPAVQGACIYWNKQQKRQQKEQLRKKQNRRRMVGANVSGIYHSSEAKRRHRSTRSARSCRRFCVTTSGPVRSTCLM